MTVRVRRKTGLAHRQSHVFGPAEIDYIAVVRIWRTGRPGLRGIDTVAAIAGYCGCAEIVADRWPSVRA